MKSLARQLLLFVVCLSGLALSQSAQAQILEDPTKWTYEVKKTGDNKYTLIFHCKISKPDWHIYALNPGTVEGSIPPSFTFTKGADYKTVGKIRESGKLLKEDVPDVGLIRYFKDKVDYAQDITVTKNVKIAGRHEYQVCNESTCLPPKSLKFSFDITDATAMAGPTDTQDVAGTDPTLPPDTEGDTVAGDVPGNDTVKGQNPYAGKNPGGDGGGTAGPAKPEATSSGTAPGEKKSLLWLLLGGIGAGLISVVTPCVFAMLPMTVSFFLKRSKDRKSGVKIALQYALNIVLIFTILGGGISAIFGPEVVHTFSTNWIVNLVFAAIFLVFAISFLGAFEINLPSSWATKLDSKANTSSFVGLFFMALTLVVVSFSCTGPFISAMLGAMSEGGQLGPLTGFFGYGLGLALPFALFAVFPGLLNELGKSGGWLNAVKVVFGFIELAMAMKFLSNADLDRGWRLLDREVYVAIWTVVSLALGLYLLGIIRFSHDSELPKNDWGLPYLKVPRLLLGLSALIFAIYLLPGMWGAPLKAMGAFVPPMGTYDAFGSSYGGETGIAKAPAKGEATASRKYADRMKLYEPAAVLNAGLEVYYDYDQALEESKRVKKPVLLDFTGIQCVNCRKFESEVWSDAEVSKRMKDNFIVASLYTDARNVPLDGEPKRYSEAAQIDIETLGDKNVDLQLTKFKSNGQPVYYFVDGEGRQLADKGVTYPTGPAEFAAHLDAVAARYKALNP